MSLLPKDLDYSRWTGISEHVWNVCTKRCREILKWLFCRDEAVPGQDTDVEEATHVAMIA